MTGKERNGVSLVYDFGEDTADLYLHTGKQSTDDLAVTFGSGFVFNYDEPGDYAGEFYDVSVSGEYRGANLGFDYCTSPDNCVNGYKSSHALLITSGFSLAPSFSNAPVHSYDYYWPIS